jgi:hypothetical protein
MPRRICHLLGSSNPISFPNRPASGSVQLADVKSSQPLLLNAPPPDLIMTDDSCVGPPPLLRRLSSGSYPGSLFTVEGNGVLSSASATAIGEEGFSCLSDTLHLFFSGEFLFPECYWRVFVLSV